MAERAFHSFGSSLKADKKEDNHKKPREAAAVFARAGSNRGLNLVPSFCVTQRGPGRSIRWELNQGRGARPFSLSRRIFRSGGCERRREKCREDLL
jgi:hypothetical protein